MLHLIRPAALLTLALFCCTGCGSNSNAPNSQAPTAAGAAYVLKAEPTGAQGIKLAREAAKDNDQIVVVGRIGGSPNPWVDGQAAFTLVDMEMKPCAESEGCPTPWDYCCEVDLLPKAMVMVKLVDPKGKTVTQNAKTLLGVKESQTLVVRGLAKRDEMGNLSILADGVFVK
ncbi:MAG: hypothetical protein SFX18_02505 [Pirellulales bacterium]|nr:hypothetical protein [Pirellulales bacterium]